MQRRKFLELTAAAYAGLTFPLVSCSEEVATVGTTASADSSFRRTVRQLLQTWGDGMLAHQINNPDDPATHGALGCPACDRIHGRCMDAVYPFVHLFKTTGEEKYLNAAILVMEWAENNVAQPDGSWTVMPDPKTWRGISVFGAIALAETLHHHGEVLPDGLRAKWEQRLGKAGEYLLNNFNLTFTNINYGFTALHAFVLIGEVLSEPKYIERANELATGAKAFFTQPNYLLFGEGKPSDALSPKGLHPVDLGYNVEESLNGITHYAHFAKDEALLDLLEKSLAGHLEFMLPDGGWDNSWGTRHAKWSYWGSRTTDGSQPAFLLLADRNPAFATAAIRTTELLARCTAQNGLLYGGIHYAEHDVPPCIHHTFAHAKPLAALLDGPGAWTDVSDATPLPRETADGVMHYPETDVWLLARGPWRATISTYDFIYKEHCFQGTGGAMTVLHHEKIGPVFLASMPRYKLVEVFNQQPQPDDWDFALTPRVEHTNNDTWYTNLYDLKARLDVSDDGREIVVVADVDMVDEDARAPGQGPTAARIRYRISTAEVNIGVIPLKGSEAFKLVLPIISPATDEVVRVSPREIKIIKPAGSLVVKADSDINIQEFTRSRVFNMVPGAQAIPIYLELGDAELNCTIFTL